MSPNRVGKRIDESARPLNKRQRIFAREFAVSGDLLKAHELAGYRPHRANAFRLASLPRVKALVEEFSIVGANLAGVHLGSVLREQAKIAFFNVGEVLLRDGDGKPIPDADGNAQIDLAKMTSAHWAAVAEIDGKNRRIKFHDKAGMLKDLRAHCAPDAPKKIEVSGKDGGPLTLAMLVGASYEEDPRRKELSAPPNHEEEEK
jgi:hypothetical protein